MGLKKDAFAIVGLGVTRQGRVPDKTHEDLKVEGVRLALEDAGLRPGDLNGWIYQQGAADHTVFCSGGVVPRILGFAPDFMLSVQAGGTSTILGIMAACAALDSGQAEYVAIGYGDNMLSCGTLVGAAGQIGGIQRDNSGAYGMYSPGACHSLAAQRHMDVFGTTKEQLGAVALAAREYANKRPDAFLHDKPLSMEDYLNARRIAGPLGKYDYCVTADGGCAFILTTAERAKSMKKRPVYISGLGFGHDMGPVFNRSQYEELGIDRCREQVFRMAGVTLDEIDVAQIYDCFTITVLMTLEGWGFCKKGESGPYVEAGNLRMDAKCPTNTAGGELSWSYMQGFTPVCEAVRQLRGEGGATQVTDAELCLVTGHGGTSNDGIGNMEWGEAGMILRRG